jgi:hypothetical protein
MYMLSQCNTSVTIAHLKPVIRELRKLIIIQVLKKFHVPYGNLRFNTLNKIQKFVVDRDQLYRLGPTEYVLPEYGDRIQSQKRCVLNKDRTVF